jgi:acyl transferase domain-containing protein/acyl carrier protein
MSSQPETPATAPLTPLQRAFLALEQTQARLSRVEQAAREPIAVIGLGCRLPGGADNGEAFWNLMIEGRDAIGPIPAERWDAEALYDPDPATPGRIATRAGGFLGEIDRFDPGFFGIAPREAQGMDPQQRLLLEVAWEALEHAGQAPDMLERSRTGVFVGVCSADYAYMQLKSGDAQLLDAHFTSGMAHSVFSGRLSYLLGLQGPSITVDTACSSSLVAVHLACQSLRSGESRMALAGGVNLILSPDLYIALSHSRMLAPDGRCKTFDASADGFARAEGCGVVVLKRLSDAQADGDRILAVIRGSAVNQDGPSSSLTAPNGPAQEAVIREALQQAGLAPREIGFIEAHGTGTQLGDPLEVHALGAVFGTDRASVPPLCIGSVKTNIGHLEAAAGVTGLIKLVLSLQRRTIPAHLHFRTPSPHIAWSDFPLCVPATAMPWEPISGRRVGGVSSFGFSGTNAHVIVEEAPAVPAVPVAGAAPPCHLMTLSARDEAALAALASRHARALDAFGDADLADICFTANTGRAHFAQRAAIVANDLAGLRAALVALSEGREHPGLRSACTARRDAPRVALMFTGQGAQYAGMAAELYRLAPVFRDALDRCAEALAPRLQRPLLDVMFARGDAPSPIDETAYTQPALFALQWALTELWRSWGVTPRVVLGHSVGELVAACVAGVMSLDDALRLVAERGRLMQSLPAGGGMLAIQAAEPRVAQALAPFGARLAIAAVNGPEQTVVAGAREDVERLGDLLASQGVRCTPLTVSHAFHSPLVEPILDAFERVAASILFSPPRVRLISNLSGHVAEAGDVTRPDYWRRHVREAVRFADGLRALETLAPDCVLEVGPHPTLLGFAAATLTPGAAVLVPSLRKGRGDWEQMLDALSSLYLAGARPDFRAVAGAARRIVDLPTYPFQRERYWFDARPSVAAAPRGRDTGHPLLGTRLRHASSETIFEARLGADAPAFARQHRVQGHVVMPATAYLDTLLAAARAVLPTQQACVENVAVQEAMILADDGAARVVQLVCEAPREGIASARISSCEDRADDSAGDAWVEHVCATLKAQPPAALPGPPLDELLRICPRVLDIDDFYAGFLARGLDFGADFRSVAALRAGDGQALGDVRLSGELAAQSRGYGIHPVLLDGCLQVLAAAMPAGDDSLFLPIGIGRFAQHAPVGTRCWSHVVMRPGGSDTQRADIRVFLDDGTPVAELADVQLKRVSRDALGRLGERWLDEALYETQWRDAPRTDAPDMAALSRAAGDAAPALREAAGIDAYDTFLPRLEALCVEYVVEAMTRLGWRPEAGERVDEAALAERLRVAPRHRRLFGRLLAILAEAGHLARYADGWTVVRAWPDTRAQTLLRALQAEFPCGAAELEFTGRVAPELAQALRDEREPMQLLFPGGSLDSAERLYRDTVTARFYNGLMAKAMVAAAEDAAANGRTLRILEIGGGTGGTTAHVVPLLADGQVQYTFTDIGPLFVARAKERFGGRACMRFQTFDLEGEPEVQGLEPASFDIVIASNVIHATADLRRSLGRVRRLLAPGGVLAMLEVTAPQRWFDLTVGLTEGWWAFSDTDLRPDYATLPRERWMSLLSECGFDAVGALPEGDGHRGALGLQSLLLARTAREAAAGSRHWLLLADEHGVAASLAARLRQRGDGCTLARPGERYVAGADKATLRADVAEDYRRLLSELREAGRPVHGALHAWALDAAAWERMTPAAAARAASHGMLSATLLAQALVVENPAPRLWLVTRGAQSAHAHDAALHPAQAPLWGLGKALALEHPELGCVCVDLDPASPDAEADALLDEIGAAAHETQVAWRSGQRLVARLTRVRRQPACARPAAWKLVPAARGSLDRFELQTRERSAPKAGEVEIAVEATGLNFKDVLNVLGMYPGDPGPLGGECAGRVTAVGAGVTHMRPGDAVMAVAGGSFASHVVARAEFVQPRPHGMGAEEGAAFPIAFVTAEFCLGHLAHMRSGDRVLVHAAAGGVGMAAVRLAQRAGAEVFATAGSDAKRALLRDMGVRHVFDSRSGAFAGEVLAATGGQGVDVVLNSLAGDALDASFRCIARGGRFVEMGKRDIKSAAWVDALGRGIDYHVVDWGETGERDPALVGDLFARLVRDLHAGRLHSLPRHVFSIDEAQRAFRFMAQARHVGKIVVSHAPAQAPAIRRDGSYLVTGGLSGLGLVVARWLAERGAGRLVLVGRRGVTPESEATIDVLRALGADVVAEPLDVADESALRALLTRLRAGGPPLRGVIHSAGVLADAGLLQQDAARINAVFAPKVEGSALLDTLTRSDPLDFFVAFSSIAAVLGSRGQANHSGANAFLDVLARERRSRGLPGLSINWCAWSDVGAAVERGVTRRIEAQGMGAVTPAQGLAAFERLLGQARPQATVLPIDWNRYVDAVWSGTRPPFLSEMTTTAATAAPAAATPGKDGGRTSDLRAQIAEAPPGRRKAVVTAFVRERALRSLGIDPSRPVDPRTPLGELGLDSLLAVELRNTLGSALGMPLPATLLFDYPTIETLAGFIFDQLPAPATSGSDPVAAAAAAPAAAPSLVDSIEDLSDEEVERMLAARTRRNA